MSSASAPKFFFKKKFNQPPAAAAPTEQQTDFVVGWPQICREIGVTCNLQKSAGSDGNRTAPGKKRRRNQRGACSWCRDCVQLVTHRVLACWMSASSTLSESLNGLRMEHTTISSAPAAAAAPPWPASRSAAATPARLQDSGVHHVVGDGSSSSRRGEPGPEPDRNPWPPPPAGGRWSARQGSSTPPRNRKLGCLPAAVVVVVAVRCRCRCRCRCGCGCGAARFFLAPLEGVCIRCVGAGGSRRAEQSREHRQSTARADTGAAAADARGITTGK
jgi:hypothetical protein